jgi:ankyrin repeat protein
LLLACFRYTPLSAACDQGHLDVVRWLAAAGADQDVRDKANDGVTPM